MVLTAAQDPHEARRWELYRALVTRVLTPEEDLEVASYGDRLNVPIGCSFSPHECRLELQNALFLQARLKQQAPKPIVPTETWLVMNEFCRPPAGERFLSGSKFGAFWSWSMQEAHSESWWSNQFNWRERWTHWAPIPTWMERGP